MTDMTQFKVTPLDFEQLKELIDEPSILSKFGWSSVDDIGGLACPAYSIEYKEYKLAFVYWESVIGSSIYDIHIMCPKNSIRAIRVLSLAIADWMFTNSELNVRALIADCPEKGTLANMAKKLGGKEYKRQNGKAYFMLPSPYTKTNK